MKDRQSLHPGRVKLLPVQGQENVYDLVMADDPLEEGDPPVKKNLFADETAALYPGLPENPVVNDALKFIGENITKRKLINKVENVATSTVDIDVLSLDPRKVYSFLVVPPPDSYFGGTPVIIDVTSDKTLVGFTSFITGGSLRTNINLAGNGVCPIKLYFSLASTFSQTPKVNGVFIWGTTWNVNDAMFGSYSRQVTPQEKHQIR